jgi:hypothetical protein
VTHERVAPAFAGLLQGRAVRFTRVPLIGRTLFVLEPRSGQAIGASAGSP